MNPWGNNYDPEQFLDFCKVDVFDYRTPDNFVSQILAIMVIEKDPTQLKEKLNKLAYEWCQVSIGRSLEKLASIAKLPAELHYGRDGLDALTYHLSGHHCHEGIQVLQAVLRRFDEDTKKPQEEPRDKHYDPRNPKGTT